MQQQASRIEGLEHRDTLASCQKHWTTETLTDCRVKSSAFFCLGTLCRTSIQRDAHCCVKFFPETPFLSVPALCCHSLYPPTLPSTVCITYQFLEGHWGSGARTLPWREGRYRQGPIGRHWRDNAMDIIAERCYGHHWRGNGRTMELEIIQKGLKGKKKKKKQLVSTTGTGLLTCLYGKG